MGGFFWVGFLMPTLLKIFCVDPDPGSEIFWTLDPEWKNLDPGSATLVHTVPTNSTVARYEN